MAARMSFAICRRSGISLLEVLVSIGVLSVGMLGAASLLPLATYYSQEASKFDRAGTLGAQAYHDLQIRGYLSPKKWIDPQGAFKYTNQSVVVIDPLALTYAAANGTTAPVYFPAFPSNGVNPPVAGGPIVFRASVDVSNSWPDAVPQPNSVPIAMPYQMADRIFRSTDDAIFDTPDSTDLRPQTPSGSLAPDFSGDYSWFVTVSHTAADIFNAPNMQRLQCSLVVFYKREFNLNPADWPAPPTGAKPPPERIVYADFLNTAVFINQPFPPPSTALASYQGGGSMMLRTIATSGQDNWLDNLKPNTYVMLSANFNDTVAGSGGSFPRIGWYRITSIDGDTSVNASGATTRMVTLQGADWPATKLNNPGPNNVVWNDADGSGGDTAFCTIVENAVAVYDDVITLDNSLLKD